MEISTHLVTHFFFTNYHNNHQIASIGAESLEVFVCDDKDECVDGTHTCVNKSSTCFNTEGSFRLVKESLYN